MKKFFARWINSISSKSLPMMMVMLVITCVSYAQPEINIETNIDLTGGCALELFNESDQNVPISDMRVWSASNISLFLEPGLYTFIIDYQYYVNINVPDTLADLAVVYADVTLGDSREADAIFRPQEELIFMAIESGDKKNKRKQDKANRKKAKELRKRD
jgi:hypothetical protein